MKMTKWDIYIRVFPELGEYFLVGEGFNYKEATKLELHLHQVALSEDRQVQTKMVKTIDEDVEWDEE